MPRGRLLAALVRWFPNMRSFSLSIVGTWEAEDPAYSRPIAAPLERCAELLGVDLATIREAAATVQPYVRVDGMKVWSLTQLERQLRPHAYGRVRGGYIARRQVRPAIPEPHQEFLAGTAVLLERLPCRRLPSVGSTRWLRSRPGGGTTSSPPPRRFRTGQERGPVAAPEARCLALGTSLRGVEVETGMRSGPGATCGPMAGRATRALSELP
jgi:hypothetical protein